MSNTVTFCVLDDLKTSHVETHSFNEYNEIDQIVNKILKTSAKEYIVNFNYFFEGIDSRYLIKELKSKSYWCLNRYDKYYVIAFSINYTRFYIYSKSYSAQAIDWSSIYDMSDKNQPMDINDNISIEEALRGHL